MSKITDAYEYSEIAKYNSGKADAIATLLNLFENELPENIKEYCHSERKYRREEASKSYDHAIIILMGEKSL